LEKQDFLMPLLATIGLLAAVAWAWRRHRRSPTRGLRRAVERARALNEHMKSHPLFRAAPETNEAAPAPNGGRADPGLERASYAPTADGHLSSPDAQRAARPGESDSLDLDDALALEELARLRRETEAQNVRAAYRRLDAFLRRYLFQRYDVKAFSVSAAALLRSLPQDITDGVVDYAGEILRICEMMELPHSRPSRAELQRLTDLAAEMIRNRARAGSSSEREAADDS
jgi:hypothetical protein